MISQLTYFSSPPFFNFSMAKDSNGSYHLDSDNNAAVLSQRSIYLFFHLSWNSWWLLITYFSESVWFHRVLSGQQEESTSGCIFFRSPSTKHWTNFSGGYFLIRDLQHWLKETSSCSILSVTVNHLDCLLYWKQILKRWLPWSVIPLKSRSYTFAFLFQHYPNKHDFLLISFFFS